MLSWLRYLIRLVCWIFGNDRCSDLGCEIQYIKNGSTTIAVCKWCYEVKYIEGWNKEKIQVDKVDVTSLFSAMDEEDEANKTN